MIVSALLHVLLIVLLIRVTAKAVLPETHSPIGDAFQIAAGGGGGGGGNSGASFEHAPPPPPPEVPIVPPPPPVVPTITPEQIPPKTEPAVTAAPRDTTPPSNASSAGGTGGGSGGGSGTGTGTGTGSGVGPGSGGGTGGGAGGGGRGGSLPTNKQMILPPLDKPKSVRGLTVEVTFTVDAFGTVVDLDVKPSIPDRGYAKKFEEAMRGYRFVPARDENGKAVAGAVTITVTL